MAQPDSKSTDVNKVYTKLEHKQHVLQLPDTYVGSVELHDEQIYVLDDSDSDSPKIVLKQIQYTPALYKIFDEILVNAEDHWTRLKQNTQKRKKVNKVTEIRVTIKDDMIEVYNNGDGIDIELLSKHKKYPVELIFGELLTSTNYDKDEAKVIGGKNGYGAKLTNIFSTYFSVETVDAKRHKKIKVEYENNMIQKGSAVIVPYKDEPFTTIQFKPDMSRFGTPELSEDMKSLMKKRVYDVAAWTSSEVDVYLNDKLIPYSTLEKYTSLYLDDSVPRLYERVNSQWEVVVSLNHDEKFKQVSFVNGVNTIRGGKHIDYIVDQLRKNLAELISKKAKMVIKHQYVKDQLMIFLKSQIVNPSFDSQTKETLTTTVKKFGSTCVLPKKLYTNILAQTDIYDRVVSHAEYKNSKSLNKSDGRKTSRIKVHKLDDANWAGTSRSKRCVLILTEGDSAKAMAVAGLSVVGRNQYGVFPLRGKILNVKDADITKIGANKEIINLKKILGLRADTEYDMDAIDKKWPLRYGSIMVMTDQDVDGSHIKGLLFNLFHELWPTLVKGGFMTSLITPIIKAFKGKKKVVSFYNLSEYETWKKENQNGKGWQIKYYKGLGTSTTKEAKEYFTSLKKVDYKWDSDLICEDALQLAFNKHRSNDRKKWLQNYKSESILDSSASDVSYSDFINKELIHFSNEDVKRSIPSLCDGLKPSQRKILYCGFKRNLKKEIRVAQFSGYVSEHSSYHHGEVSLQAAIVGMAQDYLGSNNINLFLPNGQFGTRIMGGKDAGAARYIHTQLTPITQLLYPPQDIPLYNYLDDDSFKIEPDYYIPIIPMALVNGCQGIGTGYSTTIPAYNPLDLVKSIYLLMGGKELYKLKPYNRHFKGTYVERSNKKGYISKGKYKKVSSTSVIIYELPIGTWTDDYKDFLDSILIDGGRKRSKSTRGRGGKRKTPTKTTSKKQILRSYENHSTESEVKFVLRFSPTVLNKLIHSKVSQTEDITEFEKQLKLTSTKYTNLSNIHLFDENNRIKKFTNVEDIIIQHFGLRLALYKKRKEYMVKALQKDLSILEAKLSFLMEFIEGSIELRNKPKKEIFKQLKDSGYPKFDLTNKKGTIGYKPSYDYLTRMPIFSLTKEKIEELTKQKDNKNKELAILASKTTKDLWMEDLDEFVAMYKRKFL